MPQAQVWDYHISEAQFSDLLAGTLTLGRLNRDWAAVRLLDYGEYRDIVRLIGFHALARDWPRWRLRVRSPSRRRGLDFLVRWLKEQHPAMVA